VTLDPSNSSNLEQLALKGLMIINYIVIKLQDKLYSVFVLFKNYNCTV